LKKEIKRISGDRKISTVHGPIGKTHLNGRGIVLHVYKAIDINS